MIHPDTSVALISREIGLGVVATRFIPKGTITYAIDPLEISVTQRQFDDLPESLRSGVQKFSYRDNDGNRIVSWDHAKYMNHCCRCNSISTGWGFEIAVEDIAEGEEITDDYGMFIGDEVLLLQCGKEGCRRIVQFEDRLRYGEAWDAKIREAMERFTSVEQPLWNLLAPEIRRQVEDYCSGNGPYASVLDLPASYRRIIPSVNRLIRET